MVSPRIARCRKIKAKIDPRDKRDLACELLLDGDDIQPWWILPTV